MKNPVVDLYFEENKITFALTTSTRLTSLMEQIHIVYQDKRYSYMYLKIVEDIKDMYILVNNEVVEIIWERINNNYKISIQRNSPLFLLTYGITEIIFRIILTSGEEKIFYSPPLSVAVDKRYKDSIDSLFEMLDIIYQKNNLLLYKNKYNNEKIYGIAKRKNNLLDEEVHLLTLFIQNLNKNYIYFIHNVHTSTEIAYSIDLLKKLKNIKPINLQYISMHPEELQKSYNYKGIRIQNDSFIPKKTLVEANKYTRKTYENKMIMSFIWSLYIYVCKKQDELQKFLLKDNIEIIAEQEVDNNYVLCTKIINQYIRLSYKEYNDKYQIFKGKLLEIYTKYSKALLDYPIILNKIPEPTHIFLEIYHYHNIFHLMNLWFGRAKENIPYKDMLMQFSNADRIYEYYCLLGIFDILQELGFK